MRADKIEQILEFLNQNNITHSYDDSESGKFNRVIELELEGRKFYIEWWVNQSYLKMHNEFGSPFIPFKFISINGNSPTNNHKLQLCFYDVSNEKDKGSIFYNPLPFGAFKIPFNPK